MRPAPLPAPLILRQAPDEGGNLGLRRIAAALRLPWSGGDALCCDAPRVTGKGRRVAVLRRQGSIGSLLTGVIVLTMALRALLPVGFMPSAAALQDGRFELVICTPAGPVTVDGRALPGAGHPDTPDEAPAALDGTCLFAAAAPILPAPSDPALLGPAPILRTASLPAPEAPNRAGRRFAPAQPRGPPLSA